MATVCTACGAENRDKARYCRGCAKPLAAADAPTAAGGSSPAQVNTVAARRARRSARRSTHRRRWAVGGGLIALLIGAAALRLCETVPDPATGTAPTVRETPAPLADLRPAAPVTALPADPSPNAAEDRSADVPAGALPTAAEPATPPPAAAAPMARPAAPVHPRAGPSRPVTASETAPVAAAPPREAPPAATTAANTAASAPAPVAPPASADERCADRSNFITRDLCRIQACRDPALAADPVCVRFRAMEQANRTRGAD